MKKENMVISFSGSHGTGKTTEAFKTCYEMKLSHPDKKVGILYDFNRFAPKFNLNGDEDSQRWIFQNRLIEEDKMIKRYPILVCDRTIFDSIAYSYYLTLYALAKEQTEIAKTRLNFYDTIIFKTIKNNDYLFDNKCRDTKNLTFRSDIEEILLKVYKDLNLFNSKKLIII